MSAARVGANRVLSRPDGVIHSGTALLGSHSGSGSENFQDEVQQDDNGGDHGDVAIDRLLEAAKSIKQDIIAAKFKSITVDQSSATELKPERLVSLFGIYIPNRRDLLRDEWKLTAEQHEVPPDLERNLEKLAQADYDTGSEISSRVGVGFLLIECSLALRQAYPDLFCRQSTGRPANPPRDLPLPVRIFPEFDLSVRVLDHTSHTDVIVTGRADWAFGYGLRGDASTFFVVVEAKREETFQNAKNQLLTYLAIVRERQIQESKQNCLVQGFYTDGVQYVFMMISGSGKLSHSRLYTVYSPGELKTIFNFVLGILEAAIKSSPHSTPTKDMVQKRREIRSHKKEVFDKIFEPCELYDENDENDDGILLDLE